MTGKDVPHPNFEELFRFHAELQTTSEMENIELHVLTCAQCRTELDYIQIEHPDADSLELFAMDRMAGANREAMKYHLSRCTSCSGALAVMRSDIAGITDALRHGAGQTSGLGLVKLKEGSPPLLPKRMDDSPPSFVEASTVFGLSKAFCDLAILSVGRRDLGALQSLISAQNKLSAFVTHTAVPTTIRQAGRDLEVAIEATLSDISSVNGVFSSQRITALRSALQRFEATLSSRLHILFFKSDTDRPTGLEFNPRLHFDPLHWRWLPITAQRHWGEATLSIATGLSTAAVFHVVRAAEAVTIYYLSKLRVMPLKNDLVGNLDLLKENGADERALSLADHLAAYQANPILDLSYFPMKDTANDVFEIGRIVIRRLLRDMEEKGICFRPANFA